MRVQETGAIPTSTLPFFCMSMGAHCAHRIPCTAQHSTAHRFAAPATRRSSCPKLSPEFRILAPPCHAMSEPDIGNHAVEPVDHILLSYNVHIESALGCTSVVPTFPTRFQTLP